MRSDIQASAADDNSEESFLVKTGPNARYNHLYLAFMTNFTVSHSRSICTVYHNSGNKGLLYLRISTLFPYITGNFICNLPFSILQCVPRELHLFTILFITRDESDDEHVTVYALNSQIFVGTSSM